MKKRQRKKNEKKRARLVAERIILDENSLKLLQCHFMIIEDVSAIYCLDCRNICTPLDGGGFLCDCTEPHIYFIASRYPESWKPCRIKVELENSS